MTHLTSGANIQFRHSNWARHPGTFHLSITRQGWNPASPLAWSDLPEFWSVTNPPDNGGPGALNYYFWNAQLPTGRTGRAIIYIRWVRSDSQENFFSCSDVVFDGGNGQVTGVGPNQTLPPPSPVSRRRRRSHHRHPSATTVVVSRRRLRATAPARPPTRWPASGTPGSKVE